MHPEFRVWRDTDKRWWWGLFTEPDDTGEQLATSDEAFDTYEACAQSVTATKIAAVDANLRNLESAERSDEHQQLDEENLPIIIEEQAQEEAASVTET